MKNASRHARKSSDAEAELLDENEAAALLRVCTKTLRKLRKADRIPHAQIGGRIVYRRSKLIEWIDAGGTKQQ